MTNTAAQTASLPLAAGDIVKYHRDGLARLIAPAAEGKWTAEFFTGVKRFLGKTRTITPTVDMRRELAAGREVAEVVAEPVAEVAPVVVAAPAPISDAEVAPALAKGITVGNLVVVDEAYMAQLAPAKAAAKPRATRKVRYLATLVAERDALVAAEGTWMKIGEGTTTYAADNHVYDINKGKGGDLWAANEAGSFKSKRRNGTEVWAAWIPADCVAFAEAN